MGNVQTGILLLMGVALGAHYGKQIGPKPLEAQLVSYPDPQEDELDQARATQEVYKVLVKYGVSHQQAIKVIDGIGEAGIAYKSKED